MNSPKDNLKTILENGFTLVELLVTVVIISILSSMSILAFEEYRAHARDVVSIQLVHNVRSALEAYYVDHFSYPANPRISNHCTPRFGVVGYSASCLQEIWQIIPSDKLSIPMAGFGLFYFNYGTFANVVGHMER